MKSGMRGAWNGLYTVRLTVKKAKTVTSKKYPEPHVAWTDVHKEVLEGIEEKSICTRIKSNLNNTPFFQGDFSSSAVSSESVDKLVSWMSNTLVPDNCNTTQIYEHGDYQLSVRITRMLEH